MTDKPRLTKAQRRELSDMNKRTYRSNYADDYGPIRKLLALGLVDRQEGKYGGGTYAITDAGRAALAAIQEDAAND